MTCEKRRKEFYQEENKFASDRKSIHIGILCGRP